MSEDAAGETDWTQDIRGRDHVVSLIAHEPRYFSRANTTATPGWDVRQNNKPGWWDPSSTKKPVCLTGQVLKAPHINLPLSTFQARHLPQLTNNTRTCVNQPPHPPSVTILSSIKSGWTHIPMYNETYVYCATYPWKTFNVHVLNLKALCVCWPMCVTLDQPQLKDVEIPPADWGVNQLIFTMLTSAGEERHSVSGNAIAQSPFSSCMPSIFLFLLVYLSFSLKSGRWCVPVHHAQGGGGGGGGDQTRLKNPAWNGVSLNWLWLIKFLTCKVGQPTPFFFIP